MSRQLWRPIPKAFRRVTFRQTTRFPCVSLAELFITYIQIAERDKCIQSVHQAHRGRTLLLSTVMQVCYKKENNNTSHYYPEGNMRKYFSGPERHEVC